MFSFHRHPWAAVPLLLMPLAALPVQGQEEEKKDPDRGLPLEPARWARFTTNEGTWISLDVSPDGETIVFDLVGDLYRMPIAGRRGDAPHERAAARHSAALQPGRDADRLRLGPERGRQRMAHRRGGG